MRSLLIILIVSLTLPAKSQITIGRQVIGTASVSGTAASFTLNSTAGETVVLRLNAENTILTQGFEQPDIQPFLVEFNISYSDCWNGQNAALNFSSLSGCGEGYEVTLLDDEGSAEALDALADGTYSLSVTAAGGCVFESEFVVEVPAIEPCDLHIYNVVTPNNDGFNDTWIIEGIELPEYVGNEVRIFNRWGQLVWSARNYTNDEKGFSGLDIKGNKLPEGAYLFEIALGGGNTLSGTLNLLQ